MKALHLVAELNLPALAENLSRVRSQVREVVGRAGCDEATTENIVLAVNEACMNVIQHGYRFAADQEMWLRIWQEECALVFELLDRAPPVRVDEVKPRLLEEIRPGGLGVHFIRAIMDKVEFVEPPSGFGNRLRMVKRLKRGVSTHGA